MAHHDYTRTGGIWVTAPPNPLLATEVADLDLKTFKSINGDDGGSWAPAAAIAIGGAGLALGGSNHQVLSGGAVVWLNGSLLQVNASGAATFLCNVALDGGATVASAHSLTMASGSTFTASAGSNVGLQTGSHVTAGFDSSCTIVVGTNCNFTIQADALADVLLGAGASFALSGGCTSSIDSSTTLTCSGTLAVASGGLVNVASGATLNVAEGGSLTVHDRVATVGKGRWKYRVATGADADTTYSVDDYDEIQILSLGAARTYTLTDTGAQQGDRIRFCSQVSAYGVDIVVTGEGTPPTVKAGVIMAVEYTFHSGSWRRSHTSKVS